MVIVVHFIVICIVGLWIEQKGSHGVACCALQIFFAASHVFPSFLYIIFSNPNYLFNIAISILYKLYNKKEKSFGITKDQ